MTPSDDCRRMIDEASTQLLEMAALEFDRRGPHDPRGAGIWDAACWLREKYRKG